jgi:hypothetical protein
VAGISAHTQIKKANYFTFVLAIVKNCTIFVVFDKVLNIKQFYLLLKLFIMTNLTIKRISETANLQGLNITKLLASAKNVKAKSKSSFEYTFEFARLVSESANYFKSKECKENLSNIGVDWKMEDFFNELGEGFGKAWCYRLIKAVKFEAKLQDYLDSAERFSIAEFIKFAQGVQDDKVKTEFKLKLTFGEAKLSIDDKDELKTEMSSEQIKAIITLLTRKLSTM